MIIFPWFKKEEEKKFFLVLDIGTEAIKGLVFRKEGEKIIVLDKSLFLEYFDSYDVSILNPVKFASQLFNRVNGAEWVNSQNFERNIFKKTVLKTFQNLILSLERKGLREKDLSIILSLPANIFKARIVSKILKRGDSTKRIDEKEEKAIYQKALEGAKEETCQIYGRDSGILAKEIQFVNLEILEIKIDGYTVPVLQGYKGKHLVFRILATFLPQSLEDVYCPMVFKNKKLVHQAEGLISYFKEKQNGIFLDVGGEITQIFLVKNGRLETINEFEIGGKFFSQALSEKLGMSDQEARIFKERYGKKELSLESSERIKEIFYLPSQTWFKNLKLKLKEMRVDRLLSSDIYLFGGGSELPEIKEVLKNGNWENLLFTAKPNFKIFQSADLKIFGDEIKTFNNPQYLPLLLISCQT